MEWTDFKVGQRITCTGYVCVVVEVRPQDQHVLYEVETYDGAKLSKKQYTVVFPDGWRVLNEKPIDKFCYHMKRVEERHLRKAIA
jgi:hypothetical protein